MKDRRRCVFHTHVLHRHELLGFLFFNVGEERLTTSDRFVLHSSSSPYVCGLLCLFMRGSPDLC